MRSARRDYEARGPITSPSGARPKRAQTDFLCLRNFLPRSGASPRVIRRQPRRILSPVRRGAISLGRLQLGGDATQDSTQPLGLSAPFGKGIRHAHEDGVRDEQAAAKSRQGVACDYS